jgi:hypothetical protein
MHRQYERIIALTGIVLMLLVITTRAAAESSVAPKPPPQVPCFGMNTYFSGNERAEKDNGLYHMRFVLLDGARVDLLWRTAGVQAVTVPLELSHGGALITRDGER